MEEVSRHRIRHLEYDNWECYCGERFRDEEEAMKHAREMGGPGRRLLDCIARQSHHSQPIEIVYEMRAQQTAIGTVVPSPVDGSEWLTTNQGNAERSRVTRFGCPNCGHQETVKYE